MSLPDLDHIHSDALPDGFQFDIAPVPRPFRVSLPLVQYRSQHSRCFHDLVDDISYDLDKYPKILRFMLMFGAAVTLWIGIFSLVRILLRT